MYQNGLTIVLKHMKHTLKTLWCLLSQVRWDISNQHMNESYYYSLVDIPFNQTGQEGAIVRRL